MLAALGWLVTVVSFAGFFACIAMGHYYVMRGRVDPDTQADSQSKFMMGLAASICFFMLAIVGVILLQISGAYEPAH